MELVFGIIDDSRNDIESLFNITKKLIMDNSEIRNVSCLDCLSTSWTISTLLNDRTVGWTKAKVYVYSDSVLCIDGEPIEFDWKHFPTIHSIGNSSQNPMRFGEFPH